MVRARAGSVGRLGISNRDFARLGLLYLHNGSWAGRQLISPEHVRLVTTDTLPLSLPRAVQHPSIRLPKQSSANPKSISIHFP